MDSIYLQGSEAVQRAATQMSTAADTMRQASFNVDGSVDRLERILTTFAQDMASIMHRLEEVQRMMSIPIEAAPMPEPEPAPEEPPPEPLLCGVTLADGSFCQKPFGSSCGAPFCTELPF